jgi:hypothetical protein
VSWYKNGQKVFEFINGRDPPYRNFTVTGSEIDVSSESQEIASVKKKLTCLNFSTVHAVQRSRFSVEVT